jgi:hypothetical protein
MWESRTSITENGVSIAAGRLSTSPTVRGSCARFPSPVGIARIGATPAVGSCPLRFPQGVIPTALFGAGIGTTVIAGALGRASGTLAVGTVENCVLGSPLWARSVRPQGRQRQQRLRLFSSQRPGEFSIPTPRSFTSWPTARCCSVVGLRSPRVHAGLVRTHLLCVAPLAHGLQAIVVPSSTTQDALDATIATAPDPCDAPSTPS